MLFEVKEMDQTKRVVLIFMILSVGMFIFSTSVNAAIGFKVKPPVVVRDSLFVNETAEFNITIQNTKALSDSFRLSVPDSIIWNLQTDPPQDKLSGINIEPYSSKTTHIIIYPNKYLKSSRYGVLLSIQSDYNKDMVEVPLEFNIKSGGIFIPSLKPDLKVEVEISNDGKFDPRNEANIKVFVKNKNQLALTDIEVSLKNSFIERVEKIPRLNPLERTLREFSINFNPKEGPKSGPLVITVTSGNKSFVSIRDVEIIGYQVPFIEDLKTTSGFLASKSVIEITNPGNSFQQEKVKLETNIIKSLFTSTKPEASTETEDGQQYLVWIVNLESGATTQINTSTNYRPLLYLLILILIIVFGYYAYRSPVVIDKGTKEVHKKEGGISQVKVVLHVKNRSSHSIDNVRVIDTIPTIAEYVRDEKTSSIEPTKVLKHERKGIQVTWEFESLEGYEERILTYSMKSKLAILGDMHLPKAIVKFKDKKGNDIVVRSNVHKLSS